MHTLTPEQESFSSQPEVQPIPGGFLPLALANYHEGIVLDQNVSVDPDTADALEPVFNLNGQLQEKRRLENMNIHRRNGTKGEATGFLGDIRLNIPFTEDYSRIGGNGFNAFMSHRAATLVLSDFAAKSFPLRLPQALQGSPATEPITQLGFEPHFGLHDDHLRQSIIYHRTEQGKVIVSSCDSFLREIPRPRLLPGQSLYTNNILSADHLKKVRPDNNIAFSPNSAFFKQMAERNIEEATLRDFAPRVSLIGMNQNEAMQVAEAYGIKGDPIEGLMQLGFNRGFVTNGIDPTVYWEGSTSGTVYPIIDRNILRPMAQKIWGLEDIAENETGCGDTFFGVSLAGLNAQLSMEDALNFGLVGAGAVFTSPDSNLGRANLPALKDWNSLHSQHLASMGENSFL
jgi:hypothetical protein